MSSSCRAELCSMRGGDDCLCEVFGFDPDDLRRVTARSRWSLLDQPG
jgi:hypothetical protein